jgi:predicted HicB family RNase H-like nuclease
LEKFVRLNLYLPERLVEELRAEAEREDRSLNNYVKLLLEKRELHKG